MLVAFLLFLIALLIVGLTVACYFLWKFATIIMVFEDDLAESLETMASIDKAMKSLLDMQLFFDSPEVKASVKAIMEEVVLTRAVLNVTIKKFTDRSKQKYITVWEEEQEEKDEEQVSQYDLEEARMFLEQQRQGTMDENLGTHRTLATVGRQR
jgi:hypothetical protein